MEGDVARGAWYAYVALIWLFLAALALQIFLAGLYLFGPTHDLEPHRGLGWFLHLPLPLILIAALVARVGRPTIWWVLALFVLGAIQPILATLKTSAPLLAALHPFNAVVLTLVTVKLAIDTLPRPRAAQEG
jgi:uncharacterized protein DUF6220